MVTLNVQVVTDVMVNPPQPGDPSFSQFEEVQLAISCFAHASNTFPLCLIRE